MTFLVLIIARVYRLQLLPLIQIDQEDEVFGCTSRTFCNKLKEGLGTATGYLHPHTFATVLTDSSTYSNTMAILLSNDIRSVMNLLF